MTLKNRLDKLEVVLKETENAEERQMQEYQRSWMTNDPQASKLHEEFEQHCRKTGRSHLNEWVELTRDDPVAAQLARNLLQSYRDYIKTHFGVITDEVSSAFE